jgi:hypothetical protein
MIVVALVLELVLDKPDGEYEFDDGPHPPPNWSAGYQKSYNVSR